MNKDLIKTIIPVLVTALIMAGANTFVMVKLQEQKQAYYEKEIERIREENEKDRKELKDEIKTLSGQVGTLNGITATLNGKLEVIIKGN